MLTQAQTQAQGFVLTRQSRDVRGRTEIVLWVSTPQGPARLVVQDEKPVCFIRQQDQQAAQQALHQAGLVVTWKPLPLKNFQHDPMSACYCTSIRDSLQVSTLLTPLGIEVFEADIRLTDRYLMERFIKGGIAFTGQHQSRAGYDDYSGVKAKAADYKPTLSMVSLDIECSEKGILYSIGLHSERDSRVIMVGEPTPEQAALDWIRWVESEKALLLALEEWFIAFDPDIVIGWNVIDFDFRLLLKRAEWNAITLRLGRGKQPPHWRQSSQNANQGFITVPGRVVMDGIDTLKTATYNFRSWSLESVAQELLGEGKLVHNVHDRMAEINQMFREDKVALATYNLQDCKLVTRIFAHTHLLDFAIERCCLTGVELDRIGGSVAAFTNLYLPQLHRAGYVAPSLDSDNWIASPGGYVMDSKPGLYQSVLVLDFKSLYPSIIRTFRIDPLGLVEGLLLEEGKGDEQAIAGFRGGRFHRQRHFLPKMIEDLWAARDQAKRDGEKAFSQAIKIIMNSFYGVLGSSGCRFFDHRLASSITMRGHEIMKTTRELIERKGYEVIYGDTDSTFVSLNSEKTSEDADAIGQQLVAYINQWWADHLRETYSVESALELEYETHYCKFLMPTIRGQETGSKKRYAGLIRQGEQEKMVYKGLETVRTDWTPLAQTFQQALYHRVFHDLDVDEYVRDYAQATRAGEYDSELVYRKRLRRHLSEYQKNVPPHVRAARMADEQNARMGRPLQYQNGGWIEYVITVNGPEPIEAQQSPIDYDHYVDKQLRPVADGILPFIGLSFDAMTAPQLGLF
ncbi:DNA polymerase II [Photobacterium aphoticum]|uniref:DNA polymerase n=1 Tax=Photobacterium aphoticum TaxID=754436 RepID=A0A0J1GST4_9GAMM|nr:DNA polymerase II [Photobacterium aphoticum]KLV02785.1 DNA polymerase II [Photobacterium aphoticum]PSU58111.1 DNA polymerase II [Photobacterium aphoticum]GHA36046.1 DNA polymerase [Photobacterium aphoticum]